MLRRRFCTIELGLQIGGNVTLKIRSWFLIVFEAELNWSSCPTSCGGGGGGATVY